MPAAIVRALCALVVLLACAVPGTAADVTYTYDALGRLVGVSYNCSSSATYVYDAAGNRTSAANATASGCPPVAVDDGVTAAFQTAATFDPRINDSSPAGYALTITGTGAAAHGTVVINAGTSLTYTPAAGYSGADSFTYTISDGHSGTATATVSVTVSLGSPPVAVNDAISTPMNTAKTFDPRLNDSDPYGFTLTITGTGAAAHGTVTINAGTSLTYTPTTGYTGADSFTYTISDGHGQTATATVSVTVTATSNSPPVAVNDTQTYFKIVVPGHPVRPVVTFDPRGNDSDPDGDTLTITAVTQPTSGAATVTFTSTSVTYSYNTTTQNLTTTDTFTYTISDGHGHTATATVTVNIHVETSS
jgi:hypothetical protein